MGGKKRKSHTKMSGKGAAKESSTQRKIRQINQALDQQPPDITALKMIAMSPEGFMTNEIRAKVWPVLLGFYNGTPHIPFRESMYEHKERQQIHLDVLRSFGHYPVGVRTHRREQLRSQLDRIVNSVISRNPGLCYYQGYHDIAATLLMVMGESAATTCLERLSHDPLRDYLTPTLEGAVRSLSLAFPLIYMLDRSLYQHLERSDLTSAPHFALSWLLTWYAHVVHDLKIACRLNDVFLACPHPLLPVYLEVALLLMKRDPLLMTEPEFSAIFKEATAIDSHMPYDDALSNALHLMEAFPPELLLQLGRVDIAACHALRAYPYSWMPHPHYLPVPPAAPTICVSLFSDPTAIAEATEEGKAHFLGVTSQQRPNGASVGTLLSRYAVYAAVAVAGVAVYLSVMVEMEYLTGYIY